MDVGGIGMKKAIALLLVLLVGGTAAVSAALWYKMDKMSFRTDIVKYSGEAQRSGDGILATYRGQTTRIIGSNVDRLIWALSIGEGQRRLQLTDKKAAGDAVTVQFGEKLKITVFPIDVSTDEVLIRYEAPGKTRRYTLKGYKSMEWLEKIVSPEGYWEPNEVVETKS
jgi:hypothetical protein